MERAQGCTAQVLVHTHRERNIFPIHLFPKVYGIVCKMVYNYQSLSTQTKNVCLTVKIYICLFCFVLQVKVKKQPFLMIDYASRMLIKSARAQQIPFWAAVVTSSHSDQKQQHWSWRISVASVEKEIWMCLSANFSKTKRNQDFLLEAWVTSDVQHLTAPNDQL